MGGFVKKEPEDVNKLEQYRIVPEIIPNIPPKKLQVKYDDRIVDMGNELTPTQVRSHPQLTWNADKDTYYALQLIDPDASFPRFIHWLVLNIPGKEVNAGTTVFGYLGSGPRQGTGPHRYIFLLYKQLSLLSQTILKGIKDSKITDRGTFDFQEFQESQNITGPIAVNFYRAQYDDYVPLLMRQLKEKYNF